MPSLKHLLTTLHQIMVVLAALLLFALLGIILKEFGLEPDIGIVAVLLFLAGGLSAILRRAVAPP